MGLMALAMSPAAAQTPTPRNAGAPETFTANAQVASGAGAIAATIQIRFSDTARTSTARRSKEALKGGGYAAFLTALRKAPRSWHRGLGDQKFSIRYAREEKTAQGRTITLVTDKPMFFVGGGRTDAKPRAGYEVGAIQMMVDDVGFGQRHHGGSSPDQAWAQRASACRWTTTPTQPIKLDHRQPQMRCRLIHQLICGNPRLTPRWRGSGHRDVTTLPRV